MNRQLVNLSVILSALLITSIAQAHKPSMHSENAKKPNCDMTDKMDSAEMDMDDPVMQAMMKKCAQMEAVKQANDNPVPETTEAEHSDDHD